MTEVKLPGLALEDFLVKRGIWEILIIVQQALRTPTCKPHWLLVAQTLVCSNRRPGQGGMGTGGASQAMLLFFVVSSSVRLLVPVSLVLLKHLCPPLPSSPALVCPPSCSGPDLPCPPLSLISRSCRLPSNKLLTT